MDKMNLHKEKEKRKRFMDQMNVHKEKEKARYNKQMKLFDKICERLPKATYECPTKIRKLRHLVLYFKFLQMMRNKLKTSTFKLTDKHTVTVNPKPLKPMYQKLKVVRRNEPIRNSKNPRAHIVFLNPNKNKEIPAQDLDERLRNKSDVNGNEFEDRTEKFVSLPKYEYKAPCVITTCPKTVAFMPYDLPNYFKYSRRDSSNHTVVKNSQIEENNHCVAEHSPTKTNLDCCYSHDNKNSIHKASENVPEMLVHQHDDKMSNNEHYSNVLKLNEISSNYVSKDITSSNLEIDKNISLQTIDGISSNSPDNYVLKDITNSNIENNESIPLQKISSKSPNPILRDITNVERGKDIRENISNSFKNLYAKCSANSVIQSDNDCVPEKNNLAKTVDSSYFSGSPLLASCDSSSSEKLHIVESVSNSSQSSHNSNDFVSFNSKVDPILSTDSSAYSPSSNEDYNRYNSDYTDTYPMIDNPFFNVPILSAYNYPENNFFTSMLPNPMFDTPPSYLESSYGSGFYPGGFYFPPFPSLGESNMHSIIGSSPNYSCSNTQSKYYSEPKNEVINPDYSLDSVQESNGSFLPMEETSFPLAQYFINCSDQDVFRKKKN